MNKKHFTLLVIVAVVSGLTGGAISTFLLMPPSVLAQDGPPAVIEAREFRVVDEDGKVRAKFGFGTFQDEGYLQETRLIMLDEEGRGRVALIDTEFNSSLHFQKDEGGPVLELSIGSNGRPAIGMWQARANRRVLLGLSAQGVPSLQFSDDNYTRAVLGTTELKHPDTGSTEIRAPSSLVLFDEEGKVVWSAP